LKPPSGGPFANADADEESAERSVAFSPLILLRGASCAPSVDAVVAEPRDRRTHASHRFPLVFRFAPRPPPAQRQL
jgi:hypothetical protein